MNFRIVLKTLGILAFLMGLTMASCLLYAWVELYLNPEVENGESTLRAFCLSSAIAFGTGLLMMLAGIGAKNELLRREAIVIVGVSWIEVGVLGALPYYFGEPSLDAFSAFFESVSGFTTTGSTVMNDIEANSAPLLLWRSLSQWLGGIGILVVFVAVLSFLGVDVACSYRMNRVSIFRIRVPHEFATSPSRSLRSTCFYPSSVRWDFSLWG